MADVNIIGYGVNPGFDSGSPITRRRVIDFAEALAKKGSALANADVIQAMPVKAGEAVVNVFLRVITPGTASSTAGVGDGAGTTSYIATASGVLDAAAGTIVKASGAYIQTEAAPPVLKCKLYTTDDTIDLLLGATAPQAGVVELIAEIIPVIK